MNLELPPVTSFRKTGSHQNGWSDHYGALLVAARYAGIPWADDLVIKGLWQHGVFGPWTHHTPQLLAYNAPDAEKSAVWVAREDQAELLRNNGFPRVRAVGLPILYTPASEPARRPRSLLVMPCHTIGGWNPADRTPFERYADEILQVAPLFERVVVCISPRCRVTGLWVKEFSERGLELIDGADTGDANALIRMRRMFEYFETMTTNGWGSHVAYALAFGARVSIHGTLPSIDPKHLLRLDRAWASNPAALDRASSAAVRQRQRDYLAPLTVPAVQAISDRAMGQWLIGQTHQLSPEAMRDALADILQPPRVQRAAASSLPPIDWSQVSLAPTSDAPTGSEPAVGTESIVLVRSHASNYSETFIEDHVNHLTRQLTLLYGCPFPRYLQGGQTALSEGLEKRLQHAVTARAVTPELWAAYAAELAQFLARSGAKVALVESGLMGAFVHEACEQAHLPYVVHFHGVDAFGQELLSEWLPRYQQFFKHAAATVAVSRAMRDQLIQLGAPAERVILGPYGVAVDLPAVAQPQQAPAQFLAVGRFVEKKAPHATIQAFTTVVQQVPTARLVMVGDGPLLNVCRALAAKNGIGHAVTFLGVQPRDMVSRLMAGSRAFVQHSVTAANGDSEGLPLAVLEAGAHGLPVVSTRHAGIPDAVRDGVDGLLVDEKDIRGMAAAMLRLAQDGDLAARMGASFRERVRAEYSRERSLTRLHGILAAAAEGQPVPVAAGAPHGDDRAPLPHGETPRPAAPANAPSAPADPRARIAADRNDHAACLALGRELLRQGDVAEAYRAISEADRLTGGNDETRALLRQLEELGALGEPAVENHRRCAGLLPRRRSPRPRRLLLVTNLLPPQEMGGFGRTMFEFGRELLARGHHVRVLTSDMPHLERKPSDEHRAFAPQVRRCLRLIGDWKDGPVLVDSDPQRLRAIMSDNRQAVLAEARAFRPDAVIAGNLDLLGHHFLQDLLDAGIPVLHRLGNAQPGYEVADAPQSPLYCVASCSEWVNEQLRARSYPISRYAVLPPGSPLTDYYRAFPPARDRLRLAFASLLMPYKGAHVLVEALAYLKHVGVDFTCTLAGDSTSPDYLGKLQSFAAARGFADRLSFPGFLGKTELATLFARSNVLVFPSIFEEPFGKTQIEAMAAGLLVVSSGNGGAREIIRDGVTGLFFKSGDARSLAEKLARVHHDPAWAARLAQAGQADAFRFTTGACVDRLECLLEELLSAARRKPAAPALART